MGGDECALCGGPIDSDATVVQTSDGSTATLCAACAKNLDQHAPGVDPPDVPASTSPPERSLTNFPEAIRLSESLTAFLERLAPSVEELQDSLFASEKQIHALEVEVARLKERLRHAEELLAQPPVQQPPVAAVRPEPAFAPQAAPAEPGWEPEAVVAQERPVGEMESDGVEEETAAIPGVPGSDRAEAWRQAGLTADDARLEQRYFAESAATEKMRAVRRSLGRPAVNLHPLAGDRPRVMISIAWEIVWYQYLVELAPDLAPDDRVFAFAEGMEPEELAPHFRVENATLDQGGRVDASELELALLAHAPELLTEMPADRAAALDDATEEIWNKRGQPEFRWDD